MHRGLARLERSGLHLNGDLGVPMSRVQADMPEPRPDHVDFNARLEQMDRSRMSERVRRDDVAARFVPIGGMPAHDLVDPEPREWLTCTGDEHRLVRACSSMGEQLAQALRGERPQRTEPPLVSLAVQMNPRRGCELEVPGTESNYLLDPRPGVVEEQQQRVVTQRERAARGQRPEQCLDLVALQESCARGRRPLRRHGGQALPLFDELGHACGGVLEQAAKSRQTLIASGDRVPPLRLQVTEESYGPLASEVAGLKLRELAPLLSCSESQIQHQGVAVVADRGWLESFLTRQMVLEEAAQQLPQRLRRIHDPETSTAGEA